MDAFAYDGCCFHTAMAEGITGQEYGLSLGEIAVLEAELQKKRELQRWTFYYGLKQSNFEEFRARQARYATVSKAGREKNKANGRYRCNVCDVNFKQKAELELHNITPKHTNNVNGVKVTKVLKDPKHKSWTSSNKASGRFACAMCGVNPSSQFKLNAHLQSARHKKNAAEAAEAAEAAKAAPKPAKPSRTSLEYYFAAKKPTDT